MSHEETWSYELTIFPYFDRSNSKLVEQSIKRAWSQTFFSCKHSARNFFIIFHFMNRYRSDICTDIDLNIWRYGSGKTSKQNKEKISTWFLFANCSLRKLYIWDSYQVDLKTRILFVILTRRIFLLISKLFPWRFVGILSCP